MINNFYKFFNGEVKLWASYWIFDETPALLCENKNCDIMHEKLITIIRSLKN